MSKVKISAEEKKLKKELKAIFNKRIGKLHFILYFRSWDLWGGFPSNLGGLQLVKQYMAEEIGVEDGEIIAASKGLHLYDYAWDLAKLRTNKNVALGLEPGRNT